uniref:Uncharacterized protein n=1 Tax=Sander lucioperca TaxID=283035 RepID=A0A8D0CQW3_SANLU
MSHWAVTETKMKSNMFSFKILLFAVALTLLAVTVLSWSNGDLSGSELTRLYNSPVYKAEVAIRLKPSSSGSSNVPFHAGVRVTLGDGSKWLIHKGMGYGDASDTVVTRADYMSSDWKNCMPKEFDGRQTVADLVRAGGDTYRLFTSNCVIATIKMIRL